MGELFPSFKAKLNRTALAVLVLLAFLMQSLAVQTHIHPAAADPVSAAKIAAAAPTAGHNKKSNVPADNNPDNCPLCQAFYAGQYVAPASLIFFLPMAAISTVDFALGVTPHYDAVSHSWRGRGPPRT